MRTQIILQGDNDDIEILNESLSSIEWKIEEDVNTGLFFPDFTGLRFPLFHVN
jgi:hypothetical protein